MYEFRTPKVCLLATLLVLCAPLGLQSALAFQREPVEEGVEILTRGPVHEAFAATVSFDPEPGIRVDRPAPEPIEELPPEQKLEGPNVVWIPGYWGWDDERDDFIWVSGIWRSVPPGRQWVSGYWMPSGRGSQWISGYWADAAASEIEYLPEPPETVEAGPSVEAPSADHVWVPGIWVWQQTRYVWRPGYWATGHPNWIWIPAHYVWAPRGYVFVDGYYDYSVTRRGLLFAPVYFTSRVYVQRGFSYSPAMVINPAVFLTHLFVRPSYGHYYYGDYYAANYSTRGFWPGFSYYSSRSGYDPIFAYQRWHHRADREWERSVAAEFARRRENEEARPPRTWTAQRERSARDSTNAEKSFVVTASLADVAKSKETPIRLQAVASQERQSIGERAQELRLAREERRKTEAQTAAPSGEAPARNQKPVKAKLPKSPIVAQPTERVGQGEAPPKAVETPKPDTQVEPKPRKPRDAAEPRTRDPGTPRTEPRTEPKPVPPRTEPKPVPPRTEPKPVPPRTEPKPPPKAEPKPPPKAEPKPPPKTEPKPPPKAEPKPPPKAEPKPPPKAEPKPPKAEPKPPKGEPKDKPKGEGKP
jgi:hypothetical protein